MNVLFVCTLNKARSVTADRLYRRAPGLSVRSAGTSHRAAHQVNECDLAWADWIVVFEAEHERWIRDAFRGDMPEILNVGLPNDYLVDDPALEAELIDALLPLLEIPENVEHGYTDGWCAVLPGRSDQRGARTVISCW